MAESYPLHGIRVVAFEQAVAAPLCTRHLADLGATVVKIERPGTGDFARHYDGAVKGQSAYFVWLNRGKLSLTLDVKSAAGQDVLRRLLAQADVFVQNAGPGVAERLGLDAAALQARYPRLISCSISGYGSTGPERSKKAYDLLLQGETGIIAMTGTPEAPAKVGISLVDTGAGLYAFAAILGALYRRLAGGEAGRGQHVEVSLLDAMAEWMMPPMYHFLYRGKRLARAGLRHNMIVPYGPYRTGDGGYVNLAVQNQREWQAFCRVVLRRPELAADPRFAGNEDRLANRVELEALIEEVFQTATRAELFARLDEADVPWGRLNEVDDVVDHPQLLARGRWHEVESPAGRIRALGHPMNLSEMPQRMDPVPSLGQHSEQILAELGYTPAAIAQLRADGVV